MSPRAFAALVGALAAGAALVGLQVNANATYDAGALGPLTRVCGSVFRPDGGLGGAQRVACAEALDAREAWTWPLGAAGLVTLLGAATVRVRRRRFQGVASASAGDDAGDGDGDGDS